MRLLVTLVLLTIQAVGCALYLPCKQLVTVPFKAPFIPPTDCMDGNKSAEVTVYPVFTQGERYTGMMPDTLPDTAYGNRYREYCVPKQAGNIELHLEFSDALCADHSVAYLDWLKGGPRPVYPDISEKVAVRRFGVYVYNSGPGYARYAIWDSAVLLAYQVQIEGEWRVIDQYSVPCGTGNHLVSLGPGEVVLCTFLTRGGPDLVNSRICMGPHCTDEFITQLDLSRLKKVESWWKWGN